MKTRRALVAACVWMFAVIVADARAVSPTPEATVSASPGMAIVGPAPTPALAPSPSQSPAAQMLYPSTSVSNLAGTSSSDRGMGGLATTFVVLLALCGAGLWLVRRNPTFAAGMRGVARKLVVSESRSLGNRQFLVVVEYENERMLLGITPGKIDYLCPLRGPNGEPGAFPPIKEVGA